MSTPLVSEVPASVDSPEELADRFPASFVWGAATSSYQIEGSVNADGRGPSIWDTFCAREGAIDNGDTGAVAADHYRRHRTDIDLMARLNLGAYRFSIAWPRVQPTGKGPVNTQGLDFYERLVDDLLERGITPWPTLYHWDLPQPLEDAGGWPRRDTAERFAEYAAAVHEVLGDRVPHWTTLNEPWCSAFLGYATGRHAPGRREPQAALRAAHHLLLAHGLATRALPDDASVGITLNLTDVRAASPAPTDVDAARRIDGLQNRLFLDPLLRGTYPADVVADLAGSFELTHVHDTDLEVIGGRPPAFLGINYYSPLHVAHRAEPQRSAYVGAPHTAAVDGGGARTAMGWEIDASGLRALLRRLHAEHPGLALYVTENGAAIDEDVHDPTRLAYLRDHIEACADAMAEGVDLRGYFAWSLLDNFEWSFGYRHRFGLIHVDYATQARTLKDSARWYADLLHAARASALPASAL
ncbi:GH1 family beta-glucosidase [Streptomyces sp. HUAS MG91]|uniref:Beta-glucosidase n=1 Tax=Streptomyces tabacisoli TaxID=3156398 RepID=A0AAU8IJZ0_9ACTN